MKLNHKVFWIFVFIWSLIILYGSLIPVTGLPEVPVAKPYADKVLHFASYFVLSLLYFKSLGENRKSALYAITLAISYGIIMESLQLFTGYRTFSLADISINSVAAIMAPAIVREIDNGIKKMAHG